VSERGIWEAFKKAVSNREVGATLDKKVSHIQTFGLKVFVFAADATKTKELGEGFGVTERHFSLPIVEM
jgi:hypothetical protein